MTTQRWNRRVCPLAAIALLASTPALALDPSRHMTQYAHRAWQPEDGLPQVSAQAIEQTPDGYLWVGTEAGLARFDGIRFTVFNRTNTPQLRDNVIPSLACDRQGSLWIAGFSGLTVYHDGRFHAVPISDGQASVPIFSLYISKAGELWVGSRDLVYVRRDGRFQAIKTKGVGAVVGFAETRAGLWVGGVNRLVLLAADSEKELTTADGLPAGQLNCIFANGDDLWIGTAHGAVRLHDGRIEPNAAPPPLRDAEVWAIFVDRHGVMWFGTRRGVLRVRGNEFDAYTTAEGLTDDYVACFLEDREGNFWIGTHLGGLNELRAGPFTNYGKDEGLRANSVWSVFPDRQTGCVFIGTEGGGLTMLCDGRAIPFGPHDGFAKQTVTAIARDGAGTLWVGTYDQGVYRFRDGAWTSLKKVDGLADDTVTALLADSAAMWVGTVNGVSRIEGPRIATYREGLRSRYVMGMKRATDGRLWMATARGLARFTGQGFVTAEAGVVYPDQQAYCISSRPSCRSDRPH